MKLTLKNARRLENKLMLEANDISSTKLTVGRKSFSIHGGDVINQANEEAEGITLGLSEVLELNDMRYAIRAAISEVNMSSGLTKLITREAALKNALTYIKSINLNDPLDHNEKMIVSNRAKSIDVATAVKDPYSSDSVDMVKIKNVLDESSVADIKSQQKDLVREIEQIADECARLNAVSNIVLTPDQVLIAEKYDML